MTIKRPAPRIPGYAADPWVLQARDCGLVTDDVTPAPWQLKFLVLLGLGAVNIHLPDSADLPEPTLPDSALRGTCPDNVSPGETDAVGIDPFRTDLADVTFVYRPPGGAVTPITIGCTWVTLINHLTGWFDDPSTNPAGITGVHAIGSGILNWWTCEVGRLVAAREHHCRITLSTTGVPHVADSSAAQPPDGSC